MVEAIHDDKKLENLIHVIRSQQVMLDSDLAKLYGYEVRALNQQVKRHHEKFPKDFMFQLTDKEMNELSLSQIVIAIQTKGMRGGRSSNLYAFTEIGVYMLATILKGETATNQTIFIMRSFSKMRHYLCENKQLLNNTDILKLSTHVLDQDKKIVDIESTMATETNIDKSWITSLIMIK